MTNDELKLFVKFTKKRKDIIRKLEKTQHPVDISFISIIKKLDSNFDVTDESSSFITL